MNILMLTERFHPAIGRRERHVRILAGALAAHGHRVTVVTLATGDLPPCETLPDGVRVRRIAGWATGAGSLRTAGRRRHAPPLSDPGLAWHLAALVDEIRPDLVHAHDWLVHSARSVLRHRNVPLVLTVHDHGLVCAKQQLILDEGVCPGPSLGRCVSCAGDHSGRVKGAGVALAVRRARRSIATDVDLFVPVSEAVRDDSRLHDGSAAVVVIPDFVPDDLGPPHEIPATVDARLPDGEFTMFAGPLSRHEGLEVLAEAHRSTSSPTVVIGDRSHGAPVRLTDPPDDLVIHTDWPHDDVMAAWWRASIAVVPPTWSDPFPTAALEAMACGTPVVASDIGGLREIVLHGETGLLVPPGDAAALANAIRRLESDPALRRRLGDAGRARVDRFRAGHVVARIESTYRSVLDPPAPIDQEVSA